MVDDSGIGGVGEAGGGVRACDVVADLAEIVGVECGVGCGREQAEVVAQGVALAMGVLVGVQREVGMVGVGREFEIDQELVAAE